MEDGAGVGDTAREREEGETWRELETHVHTIQQQW